jgi:hypothetical protein
MLAQQISQFPDVFFVDGSVYTNIAAAYGTPTSGCLKTSLAFDTCEIWDYNLQRQRRREYDSESMGIYGRRDTGSPSPGPWLPDGPWTPDRPSQLND